VCLFSVVTGFAGGGGKECYISEKLLDVFGSFSLPFMSIADDPDRMACPPCVFNPILC